MRSFALTLILLMFSTAAHADGWRRISDADGIIVETREVAGQEFPEFRGIAVLPEPLHQVAAVISDLTRTCQWTSRCADSHEVSRKTEFDRIFYTRTNAPWPASDRDAVLHATMTGKLAEGQDIKISFESTVTPLEPLKSGVVRMAQLKGGYHMVAVSPTETRVEFRVAADIGGWVPGWMVKMLTKAIPRDTLAGLRKQVTRMRGKYDDQIKRWQATTAS